MPVRHSTLPVTESYPSCRTSPPRRRLVPCRGCGAAGSTPGCPAPPPPAASCAHAEGFRFRVSQSDEVARSAVGMCRNMFSAERACSCSMGQAAGALTAQTPLLSRPGSVAVAVPCPSGRATPSSCSESSALSPQRAAGLRDDTLGSIVHGTAAQRCRTCMGCMGCRGIVNRLGSPGRSSSRFWRVCLRDCRHSGGCC
jgi:hypothetical protein